VIECSFYIDGAWQAPASPRDAFPIVNPATEEVIGSVAMGAAQDIDRAVAAARTAFPTYSLLPMQRRVELLERLRQVYIEHYDEFAQAVTREMGAPCTMSRDEQAECGPGHIDATLAAARDFAFRSAPQPGHLLTAEPIGVCGLITPWNWPINQIFSKLAPALLVGCTVVLKPSEQAPLSARLLAQCIDEAGYPPGVFNLVYGDGPVVGHRLCEHPDVDMVSFTGSTRAGISVAVAAAPTIKRVVQELGGKSPNLVFEGVDLPATIRRSLRKVFHNSGQSCNAPTRMLVERGIYEQAVHLAAEVTRDIRVGSPDTEGDVLGPLASRRQFDIVQAYIQAGIDEGARLIAGGTGRPKGYERGFYVRPTVFADVRPGMRIEREEIFGPVLCMMPFDDEAHAIELANDTPYGLAAYVQCADPVVAQRVAARLRAGTVSINGVGQPYQMPFGGFKQSGNGREWGRFGIQEFIEWKAINGA